MCWCVLRYTLQCYTETALGACRPSDCRHPSAVTLVALLGYVVTLCTMRETAGAVQCDCRGGRGRWRHGSAHMGPSVRPFSATAAVSVAADGGSGCGRRGGGRAVALASVEAQRMLSVTVIDGFRDRRTAVESDKDDFATGSAASSGFPAVLSCAVLRRPTLVTAGYFDSTGPVVR